MGDRRHLAADSDNTGRKPRVDDLDARHPVADAHAGVLIPRDPYAPTSPYAGSAYALQESEIQVEGYEDAGYGYQSLFQAQRMPSDVNVGYREYARDRYGQLTGRINTRRVSLFTTPVGKKDTVSAFRMISAVGEPFSGNLYPRDSSRPWERDHYSPWYVSKRYRKSGTGRPVLFGYPSQITTSDFTLDWNRIFETLPFFIQPRFIAVDAESLRVVERCWHGGRRFHELKIMSSCVELYDFASWFHPDPVMERLRGYCGQDGDFPGGIGLTPGVSDKPSFHRLLLLNRVEFRQDNLPRDVDEFCRAQFCASYSGIGASA